MAFCKVCACREKIVFQGRLGFPDNCPSCGRKLIEFQTYDEADPRVAELMRENSGPAEPKDEPVPQEPESRQPKYALKLSTGTEIPIPDEGCIIGRTEVGGEELAAFSSVSRQHLRVTPRRNIGVLVEDLSTYGTLVDGRSIVKNEPVRVKDGTRITLCNLDAVLVKKEGDG